MLAYVITGPRVGECSFIDIPDHPDDCAGSNLFALQAQVGGMIECIALNDELDAWINEEGKLIPLEPTALWCATPHSHPHDVVMGTIVVLRHDDEGCCTPILPSDLEVTRSYLLPIR